jgi:DNA polymerase-3 subunit delta
LATLSLFGSGGPRVAIVRDADKFVTKHRSTLEDWTVKPAEDSALILVLNKLAANTKLFKVINKHGLCIKASPPTSGRSATPNASAVATWLVSWAKSRHGLTITKAQANIIVERSDDELGMLDCEVAKLALYANDAGKITDTIVRENVGGWRTHTMWEIADAIADGKANVAMEQIDHLLMAGQTCVGLVAQLSWSMRRYSMAAHLFQQAERCGRKAPLKSAIGQAGFHAGEAAAVEKRLIRMGRERAKGLLNGMVELDLQMKGTHSGETAARRALERFVFELCI